MQKTLNFEIYLSTPFGTGKRIFFLFYWKIFPWEKSCKTVPSISFYFTFSYIVFQFIYLKWNFLDLRDIRHNEPLNKMFSLPFGIRRYGGVFFRATAAHVWQCESFRRSSGDISIVL